MSSHICFLNDSGFSTSTDGPYCSAQYCNSLIFKLPPLSRSCRIYVHFFVHFQVCSRHQVVVLQNPKMLHSACKHDQLNPDHNDHTWNGGMHMKIRLTARGMAVVKKMNMVSGTIKAQRPEYRQFTLIRIDGKGRAISKRKVMVNMNRYFQAV